MIIGVAKTRLYTDTRILQIWDNLTAGQSRKLFLLSDAAEVDRDFNFVKIYDLKWRKILQGKFSSFTAICWHILVFIDLCIQRPDKVIVFDKNAILGPLLYSSLTNTHTIYDDHELPNSRGRFVRIERFLERLMYRKSHIVYVASIQRAYFIKVYYSLNRLPFVIENNFEIICGLNEQLENKLRVFKSQYRIIHYHQGRIIDGRGISILNELMTNLEEDELLILVGTDKVYNRSNIVTLGILPQNFLPIVYKYVDVCHVFYDNDTINNTLCAPNRYYLAKRFKKAVQINNNVFLRSIQ